MNNSEMVNIFDGLLDTDQAEEVIQATDWLDFDQDRVCPNCRKHSIGCHTQKFSAQEAKDLNLRCSVCGDRA